MMSIAVWGLGKMGVPLAAVCAHAGFSVTGIDIDKERVDTLNSGKNPFPREPGLTELLSHSIKKGTFSATTMPVPADIHMIIVPILLKNSHPDFSALTDVVQKISTVLHKGDIVVLESTAPPGTCETVVKPLLEETGLIPGKDFGVAHCPERTMSGSAIKDITEKYPKIIGASDSKTYTILKSVYTKINTKGVIQLKDTTTAEAVKVFEGIYRDVNIALSNELALYCERIHIDVTEVIAAANTQPYCHLHDPGAGVGGHCIPVYPYFIMSEKTPLVKTARNINDSMPHHVIDLAEELLTSCNMSLQGAGVLLLGIAFRGGVKEERFSPFFPVRDELLKRGAVVYGYDPLYTKEEVESFHVNYSPDFENNDIDVVIILTDHKEVIELNWGYIHQQGVKILIDGRNVLDSKTMKALGFEYAGVGKLK